MLFNSLEFAVFFPIVTALFFLLPQRGRVPLLLLASCVFYMAFIPKYVLILFGLILVDYAAGLLIERSTGQRRTAFLVLSLCANLGILGFFKYFNFFSDNLAALAHLVGWNYALEHLRIILPIGLSFHTFQSMSYTIEVYRGRQAAERSLLHFALYVLFYPQLVAGPIERPQNLLHQFREYHRFSWANLGLGLRLMFSGLFKKIIIADRVALAVNAAYANPAAHSATELLLATWCFAIQIYCDFAGYTEIARGAAKVMGFDLMVNFNRPYLATSIVDFWRRWHISLSTWFRDYLYVPLGGNRGTRARTCFNLAVVFLVSGLWHGANWTFIVWGGLHAACVIGYVLTEGPRTRFAARLGRTGRAWFGAVAWLATFNFVCLAWVFFRAASVSDAMTVLRRIAAGLPDLPPVTQLGLDATQAAIAAVLIAGLALVEMASRRAATWDLLDRQPRVARWTAYYILGAFFVVMLLLSPQQGPQPFVYFQF